MVPEGTLVFSCPLAAYYLTTLQNGYGSRLIPDGTIQGAYFVETPDYVQITGKLHLW